uniref:menin-like isoform X1 n=1 Tax=Styela clava TaxID=7725 RepID=UPI00193ABFA5|nr:menin-like isoform X1 [Styela clava]
MEISQDEKSLFPIQSSDGFIEFFQLHLKHAADEKNEPNLAFLSILLGVLEYKLTLSKTTDQPSSSSAESDAESLYRQGVTRQESKKENAQTDNDSIVESDLDDFPTLDFDVVEALYLKFKILVKGFIDKSSTENTTRGGYATKELCKKVSDLMWNRLNPHYHKDKAHIQSLFSFLTGRQLDCFGLALMVVAACQILLYNDVHLALSEDHAWIVHGDNCKEATEITWHGKGNEDKRGFPVNQTNTEKSWMYLHNKSVICNRLMELSAMIVSINPSIDVHFESKTLADIQLKLLKIMYKNGALERYPMGLSFLADLEDSVDLHDEAVKSVQTHYNNLHVFPHCAKGHFHLKHNDSKKAIHCWSMAAQVLSNYNYTREDEEIYKEIMDIAGESISQAMKNDPSVCDSEECFMDLIKFYDEICLWEEDSSTPVLHSWWAKYFTQSLGRFSTEVRHSFSKELCEVEEVSPSSNANDVTEDENQLQQSSTEKKLSKRNLRKEDVLSNDNAAEISLLGVKSVKMKGLEELLIGSKKINAQAVSLQLTAQSQTHFAKRHSNDSYMMGQSGRVKKPKKFFE